jgi:hypothetical protein
MTSCGNLWSEIMRSQIIRAAIFGLLSFGIAGTVSAAPITDADYVDDFASPAPSSGWSYLWNGSGAIGNSANYDALIYNAGQGWYTTTGGPVPNPAPGSFGIIGDGFAHPGSGFGIDRYAIAAYTVSAAGSYSLTDSFAVRGDPNGGTGVQILVNVNNGGFLLDTLVGTGGPTDFTSVSLDTSLGSLDIGDTIYVSIGPNDSEFFDSTNLDYTITMQAAPPSISEPGTLALFGLGLVGVGFARSRKTA